MPEQIEQIEITGELVSSQGITKAGFKKKSFQVKASAAQPLVLIFSANYTWEGRDDEGLNNWDFYMTITDETGEVIHSEYKHFGEDEPGFTGKDGRSYKEYLKEEGYLRHYKARDEIKKGAGTMARSIKAPAIPGTYTYSFKIAVQCWKRKPGEKRRVEKHKTESSDEAHVSVIVK